MQVVLSMKVVQCTLCKSIFEVSSNDMYDRFKSAYRTKDFEACHCFGLMLVDGAFITLKVKTAKLIRLFSL